MTYHLVFVFEVAPSEELRCIFVKKNFVFIKNWVFKKNFVVMITVVQNRRIRSWNLSSEGTYSLTRDETGNCTASPSSSSHAAQTAWGT